MNTMNTIYLTVLGTIAAFFVLTKLNRLHPWSRLRHAMRRLGRWVLDSENFESLVIDEMRTHRRGVDNWVRDMPSKFTTRRLDRNIDAQGSRVTSLKREVEELGILLRQYTNALGPMWTTAAGHRMPMRLLSTLHLRNILEGGFCRSDVGNDYIRNELDRRSVDARYRAAESAATSDRRMSEGLKNASPAKATPAGWADPRLPMTYTPEVANRVARVLPQWAQDIIADLVQEGGRAISFDERKRIRMQLPIWAQQTISDLWQAR